MSRSPSRWRIGTVMIAIAAIAPVLGVLKWLSLDGLTGVGFVIASLMTIVGGLPFAVAYRFRRRGD